MKIKIEHVVALIIGMILLGAVSWLITVGIVKLITLCFGWKFSLLMATGVWLILLVVKALMPSSIGEK